MNDTKTMPQRAQKLLDEEGTPEDIEYYDQDDWLRVMVKFARREVTRKRREG